MKNMPRFVMLSKILGIRQANFCDIVQRNMYVKNYKVSCTKVACIYDGLRFSNIAR